VIKFYSLMPLHSLTLRPTDALHSLTLCPVYTVNICEKERKPKPCGSKFQKFGLNYNEITPLGVSCEVRYVTTLRFHQRPCGTVVRIAKKVSETIYTAQGDIQKAQNMRKTIKLPVQKTQYSEGNIAYLAIH